MRRRPRFMVGAGVEDPAFQGRHSFSAGGRELPRWPAVLDQFARVTVRGPRSQELAGGGGRGGRRRRRSGPAARSAGRRHRPAGKVVGVTLGFGDDLWGHDHRRVEAAVSAACGRCVAKGWRVRLLCMNDDDREGHAAVARRPGPSADGSASRWPTHPPGYLHAVSAMQRGHRRAAPRHGARCGGRHAVRRPGVPAQVPRLRGIRGVGAVGACAPTQIDPRSCAHWSTTLPRASSPHPADRLRRRPPGPARGRGGRHPARSGGGGMK